MIYLKQICHPDEFISDNHGSVLLYFTEIRLFFFANPEKIVKKTTEIC